MSFRPMELDEVLEAAHARIRADRMACGLPSIVDPVAGDLEEVERLRARVAALEEALRKLSNEASGLGIASYEVRDAIGNTNWDCLMQRIDEACALLAGKEDSNG